MLRSALTSPVRKSTPHGLHCDWDLILPLSLSLSLSPPSPPISLDPDGRNIGKSDGGCNEFLSFFSFFSRDFWDSLGMLEIGFE